MNLKFIKERGIKVDVNGLRQKLDHLSAEITMEMVELNETLITQGLPQIRPSSTEDISNLIQAMGIKLDWKTGSGEFSVDQDTFGKIDSPIVVQIVRIRKMIKEKDYMERMLTSAPKESEIR